MKKLNQLNKSVVTSDSHNPEFLFLQLERMKLEIEQIKLDLQIRRLNIKEMTTKTLCDKIEQARRNTEILSKIAWTYHEKGMPDKVPSVQTVLDQNIEILKEVKDIK